MNDVKEGARVAFVLSVLTLISYLAISTLPTRAGEYGAHMHIPEKEVKENKGDIRDNGSMFSLKVLDEDNIIVSDKEALRNTMKPKLLDDYIDSPGISFFIEPVIGTSINLNKVSPFYNSLVGETTPERDVALDFYDEAVESAIEPARLYKEAKEAFELLAETDAAKERAKKLNADYLAAVEKSNSVASDVASPETFFKPVTPDAANNVEGNDYRDTDYALYSAFIANNQAKEISDAADAEIVTAEEALAEYGAYAALKDAVGTLYVYGGFNIGLSTTLTNEIGLDVYIGGVAGKHLDDLNAPIEGRFYVGGNVLKYFSSFGIGVFTTIGYSGLTTEDLELQKLITKDALVWTAGVVARYSDFSLKVGHDWRLSNGIESAKVINVELSYKF